MARPLPASSSFRRCGRRKGSAPRSSCSSSSSPISSSRTTCSRRRSRARPCSSPFFIIVAVTLFGALLGVLGALTAVPLAATIQIFVQELTKARGGCRGESRPRSTMTVRLAPSPRSGVMAHDFRGETVRMGLLESTSFDSGVTLLRVRAGAVALVGIIVAWTRRSSSDGGRSRSWLEQHHATASELWVGYHKKASGRRSLTWSEVVDEALCFGWIDGKVQRIDEHHLRHGSPTRPNSNWSAVNVAKVAELRAQGRLTPAGEAAFAARREDQDCGLLVQAPPRGGLRRRAGGEVPRMHPRGTGSRRNRPRIAAWPRSGWSAPSDRRRGRGGSRPDRLLSEERRIPQL